MSAVEPHGGSAALSGPPLLVGSPAASLSADPRRAAQIDAQAFLLAEIAARNKTIKTLRNRIYRLEASRDYWIKRCAQAGVKTGRGSHNRKGCW